MDKVDLFKFPLLKRWELYQNKKKWMVQQKLQKHLGSSDWRNFFITSWIFNQNGQSRLHWCIIWPDSHQTMESNDLAMFWFLSVLLLLSATCWIFEKGFVSEDASMIKNAALLYCTMGKLTQTVQMFVTWSWILPRFLLKLTVFAWRQHADWCYVQKLLTDPPSLSSCTLEEATRLLGSQWIIWSRFWDSWVWKV